MNKNRMEEIANILNKGGIIIFPTDTAFGIGCRIDNQKAVEKLLKIKKRPLNQLTPVLVSNLEMAKKYIESIPKGVEEKLIRKFWPGALTIILKAKENLVPELVRGGGENLGVRIPNNKNLLKIIDLVGVPILGPSANFSQEKTPFSTEELDPNLIKLIDYVMEGDSIIKNVSTVIDCTSENWKILRQGAVRI